MAGSLVEILLALKEEYSYRAYAGIELAQVALAGFLPQWCSRAGTKVPVRAYIPSTGRNGMPCRPDVASGVHVGINSYLQA